MFRFLGVIAVIGAMVAAAFGSAATLGVNGTTVQAGVDSILYCDTDGVYVDSWMVNDIPGQYEGVEGVRIKGVSGNCAGARMYVRVDDGAGAVLAYSKPGTGTPGQNNWVIPQSVEPAGGYVFHFTEGNRTTPKFVDPALIEKLTVWIEGSTVTPAP